MVVTGVSIVAVVPANAVQTAPIAGVSALEGGVVSGEDIRPNESTYPGWHEGYANTARAYSVQDDGLHLGDGNPSQIINGFDEELRTDNLGALIASDAGVVVTSGSVTYQVPVYYGSGTAFATLRSASLTDAHSVAAGDAWVLRWKQNDTVTEIKGTLGTLATLVNEQGNVRVLGFGVQADSAAVVRSITWNGATYTFAPYEDVRTVTSSPVVDSDIAGNELSYKGWHEGYANPTRAFSVTDDGLNLGENGQHSQILNGLVETGDPGIKTSAAQLARLIQGSQVKVTAGTVQLQVAVTFGETGWATLRSNGPVQDGVSPKLTDLWTTSKDIPEVTDSSGHVVTPKIATDQPVTLADLLDAAEANGNLAYSGYGILAYATPATVTSVAWDAVQYNFTPYVDDRASVPTNVLDSDIAGTEAEYKGWHEGYVNQTRAFSVTADGLSLGEGNVHSQIINGLVGTGEAGLPTTGTALSRLIQGSHVDLVSGAVQSQVAVTFGTKGWTTLRSNGTLTDEMSPKLTDEWTTSKEIPAVLDGSNVITPTITAGAPTALGDLIDALAANGNVAYSGFGVLAYAAPALVKSITWDASQYNFVPYTDSRVATTQQVTGSDIAGNEASYRGWHEGYWDNATRAYSVSAEGLSLGEDGMHSQILNGLVGTGEAGLSVGAADLAKLIQGSRVAVADGSVQLQVAVTYNGGWATLRSNGPVLDGVSPKLTDAWMTSRAIPETTNSDGDVLTAAIGTSDVVTLGDLIDALAAHGNVAYSGYGILAYAAPALVTSVTWNGVQFDFVPFVTPAVENSIAVTSLDVRGDETEYLGWHEGDKTTPAHTVDEDGLHFGATTQSQILNGLVNSGQPGISAENLTALILGASARVESGAVNFQVPVTFGTGGGYATLRPVVAQSGDVTFGLTQLWTTSKDLPQVVDGSSVLSSSVAANSELPLGDLLDALYAQGNVLYSGFGVLTNEASTVTNIVWNGTQYDFTGLTVGTVDISGTPAVGEILTAETDGWGPAGVDFTYQWMSGGEDIVGATDSTFTLTPDQNAKTVVVKVTGELSGYAPESWTSLGTTVTPGTLEVVTPPVISGAAQVGQVLTATSGTWSPAVTSFTYQWKVGGVPISGATSADYTVRVADIGSEVTVDVTATLNGYSALVATADATSAVSGSAVVVKMPTVTGTARVGDELTVDTGEWAPSGITFGYQWRADGAEVAGAVQKTYTPVAADLGKTVTVTVTGATTGSIPVSVTSDPTPAVIKGEISLSGASITGTAKVGETLSAVAGAVTPSSVAFTYQWSANGVPIPGATNSTLTPTAAQDGAVVTVAITANKAGYDSASATSPETGEVAKGVLSAGAVSVAGTARVGEMLTAHIAESAPAGATATFEWFVGDATVEAATGPTYTPVVADYDQTITVKATSSLTGYEDAPSEFTTAKVAVGVLTAGAVTIDGTAQVGQVLTARAAATSPSGATLAYQWSVDGTTVAGATSASYTVRATDAAKTVTVTVTSTLNGYAKATAGATTAKVAPGTLTAGSVEISGTAQVRETLHAIVGVWAPTGVTFTYQWKSNGEAISGATAASFTPTTAESGTTIAVTVQGSLTGYATRSATSFGTTEVAAAADTETSRVSGADRYSTAVAISAKFDSGVPVVYVATGANYADALSAAPAAAHFGGPLLLTPTASLPSNVKAEIQRLKPAKIIVVGGPSVVSNSVLTSLKKLQSNTVRIYGADRYDTSRLIASSAFKTSATAYVATGLNFPDALSASAAAGAVDGPVILVNGAASTVDTATKALLTHLKVTTVKIAGGSAVVSNGIARALDALPGVTVKRLAGIDRYATSVAINADAFTTSPVAYLAVGTAYADALAGAALAGNNNAPLYVVPGSCVPKAVLTAIDSLGVSDVVLFGGAGALSKNVANLTACK